jgi:hypothetical protein
MEASMGLLLRTSLHAWLLIGPSPCALAEDGKANAVSNFTAQAPRSGLTGKERLGPKWTDEQRIDNCHVPFDKRGSKSRSDNCPSTPSS